jgi:hypothetical protein
MASIYRKSEIPSHLQQFFAPAEIGLEPTPAEYVEQMVQVFREVRRVLRDDGTLWLNLGDSYARTGGTDKNITSTGKVGNTLKTLDLLPDRKQRAPNGLKDKDLIGIPWRVAFALQADGWYLRQDIIWHKPNPMPESVTDRCTKSHEYVFLLTKKATYCYDSEAIAEPVTATPRGSGRPWIEQSEGIVLGRATNPNGGLLSREPSADGMRNKRSVWTIPTQQVTLRHDLTDEQRAHVVTELLRRGLL